MGEIEGEAEGEGEGEAEGEAEGEGEGESPPGGKRGRWLWVWGIVRGVCAMAGCSLYTVYASNPGRQATKD